jgi:hypothetical protein
MRCPASFLQRLGWLVLSCASIHCLHGQETTAVETAPPADKAAAAEKSAHAATQTKIDAEVDGLLFFATDDTALPTAIPEAVEDEKSLGAEALKALRERLGKAYQHKHFQLLGRHTQMVFKEYESWVVPSKELCLKLDSRGPIADGGVNLNIQLWQEKKVLVKSEAPLKPDQPILIGGPAWRQGRLIFVLLQKTPESSPKK